MCKQYHLSLLLFLFFSLCGLFSQKQGKRGSLQTLDIQVFLCPWLLSAFFIGRLVKLKGLSTYNFRLMPLHYSSLIGLEGWHAFQGTDELMIFCSHSFLLAIDSSTKNTRELNSLRYSNSSIWFIKKMSPLRESGFRNSRSFCLWNPESGKICLWNLEPWVLESRIQFKESQIQVPLTKIGIQYQGIRNLLGGIPNPRLSCIPLRGAENELNTYHFLYFYLLYLLN